LGVFYHVIYILSIVRRPSIILIVHQSRFDAFIGGDSLYLLFFLLIELKLVLFLSVVDVLIESSLASFARVQMAVVLHRHR